MKSEVTKRGSSSTAGAHHNSTVSANTNSNNSAIASRRGKKGGGGEAPWSLQRIVLIVGASFMTLLIFYVVVASSIGRRENTSRGGRGLDDDDDDDDGEAKSAAMPAFGAKPTTAELHSSDDSATTKAAGVSNGDGSSHQRKQPKPSGTLPPLKAAPEVKFKGFITTKDAFLKMVKAMSPPIAAPLFSSSSSSSSSLEKGSGNNNAEAHQNGIKKADQHAQDDEDEWYFGRDVFGGSSASHSPSSWHLSPSVMGPFMRERRVDSCGPPFISPAYLSYLASSNMTAINTTAAAAVVPDPFDRRALKAYLHKEVDTLLKCGTRVGAATHTEGYQCAMKYLRARMRCLDAGAAAPNSAEEEEGGGHDSALHKTPKAAPRPASRRWWKATIDSYDKVKTVIGDKYFSNFVAEFNPNSPLIDEQRYGHLILAAHWDSKEIPADPKTGQQFVAATDSAVPVVLILEIMKYVSTYCEMLRHANGDSDEGLFIPLPKITVMLFDGEEAFVEWKDDDNTYGSRLQAARWKREKKLRGISTFMLLDLIGAVDSQMHNLFHGASGKQYASLRNIEMAFFDESVAAAAKRSQVSDNRTKTATGVSEWRHWPIDTLGRASIAFGGADNTNNDSSTAENGSEGDSQKKNTNSKKKKNVMTRDSYFPREPLGIRYAISDDHEPWLRENVPILHLISLPFPKVWHTTADDNAHVHYDTVYEYLRVFTEFVLRYTKAGADPMRA